MLNPTPHKPVCVRFHTGSLSNWAAIGTNAVANRFSPLYSLRCDDVMADMA